MEQEESFENFKVLRCNHNTIWMYCKVYNINNYDLLRELNDIQEK